MDAVVTARVPVALKERGNEVLREIGCTPTQLINAAYEFVLAERDLPKAHHAILGTDKEQRTLTVDQQAKIKQALKAMYIGPLEDNESFKQQLDTARNERYAYFA